MIVDVLIRDKWCGGQLLAFSAVDGPTDHDQGLTARTSFGQPGIEVKVPGAGSIEFPASARTKNCVTGDCFHLRASRGAIRGVLLDAHHLLIEGPCEVRASDDAIAQCSRNGRVLLGAVSHFDADRIDDDLDMAVQDRNAWLKKQQSPPDLQPTSRRTLCKMLSVMKTQAHSPQGQIQHHWTTPDRWPHRNMWLWDSVFHAIGWRHVDPELAKSMLSAVVDTRRGDGFIGHMMTPHGISEITQPPILAFGVKLVNDVAPDRQWIESLYAGLSAYVEWDLANRDTDGAGLVEWAIGGDANCRSGESGMDNSPRFDTATQLKAVDFNSFLALECEVLALFAGHLALDEDVSKWTALHRRLCALIADRLWSEKRRFFVDYDVDKQQVSSVLASSGFLPLLCGAASQEQARQLAAHLEDPSMFGTPFPVPSIAVCDVDHYAKDMWRGPTWTNLNWLIAYGFERYGFCDTASELRQRSISEIEKFCEQCGVAFEYYDDRGEVAPPVLLRKSKCAPAESPYHQVIHDYGWTAALYADMVYSRSATDIKAI